MAWVAPAIQIASAVLPQLLNCVQNMNKEQLVDSASKVVKGDFSVFPKEVQEKLTEGIKNFLQNAAGQVLSLNSTPGAGISDVEKSLKALFNDLKNDGLQNDLKNKFGIDVKKLEDTIKAGQVNVNALLQTQQQKQQH